MKKSVFKYLFIISLLLTVCLAPLTSVRASPKFQQEDPAAQCSDGVRLYRAGNYVGALPLLESGIANRDKGAFAESDDLGICALVLASLLGNDAEAITAYQIALTTFQESGNQELEGITLNNLGAAYHGHGQYKNALDAYQQALALARKVGDRVGESITLNNIGLLYHAQGQYTNALDAYQQALALARKVGDRENEGAVLNGIGMVYDSQGRYTEALELFKQALAITREMGNPARESLTLSNIGAVYDSQGRYSEALESYQQALGINREVGDRAGERTILNNIGELYASQSQYTKALEYFQEALEIHQEVGNRAVEGITFNNIGLAYEGQGQYIEALMSYQEALRINREVGDRASEGATLHNMGLVYKLQGRYAEALEYYQEALRIDREVGNREGEAITLSHIGVVYEAQGRFGEALEHYEKAIDILETLRSSAGSETARSTFIAQYSEKYDRAVTLYIQEGLPEKAFLITERGRSRAFLDSLATGYVELSDSEFAALYNREQESYAIRQNVQDALTKAKAQDPPAEKLIADLESQLTLAEADYQAALDRITARGDQLSQLIPGRNTVLDVKQAQALLDDKTILLSFWVTEEQTFVFVLSQNSLDVVSLNISRTDLYNRIEAFRTFANTNASHPDSSVELYKSLIEPLKPYLHKSHLVIIPHGELHYLPFAALTDGSRFLLDDYVITYLPSASTLPFIQQNAQEIGGQPLIIGNPTTGDYDTTASLSTERDELGPLPFAGEEVKEIASQLGIQPFIEVNATETLVKQQAPQTKILHLAAHGVFNSVAPLSSLIALAPDQENDGWLTVSEVYGLNLKNTDLVVLSACETQIGQLTSGDEFVGLTRAFFFAGTPTVVASLWSVDDKATSLLMERFYIHMQEGMSKAEALRQAQMDIRKQYPNPYYWAAFVLNGDAGEVTETHPVHLLNWIAGVLLILLIITLVWLSKKRRMPYP